MASPPPAAPRVTLHRFLAPYYALNATVPLAYLVLRQYFWTPAMEEREGFLNIPREQEVFVLVIVMYAINYRKKATLDGRVAMLLTYVKTGVLAGLYYMDRRLLGWMLVYCAILFIAVGHPKYAGPHNITPLNPATMEQYVKRMGGTKPPSSSGSKKNVSWLVYLYADWSDHCLQHDPLLAELSLTFGSDTLRFGSVDLAKFPELARDHQIDVSTTSSQLPTLILFQGGEEIDRLPRIDAQGNAGKVRLDRAGVIAVFRLQDLKEGKKRAFHAKSK